MDVLDVYHGARSCLPELVVVWHCVRWWPPARPSARLPRTWGVSQSAVSQQLKSAREVSTLHPNDLMEAAAPVLRAIAAERGYGRLAVFGSVARRDAGPDSDVDLLVEAPPGTSTFEFLRFKTLLEEVLGREVDLVSYGGLRPAIDDDVRREMVPL